MSGRALWVPKRLESWDWREAIVEESRPRALQFEAWARPDSEIANQDPGRTVAPRSRPDGSRILIWIGFSVATMAAMVLALSMIYGQLVSALTGFPTTPLLPIGVLATSFVIGVGTGSLGIVLDSRRSQKTVPDQQPNRPDTSIAA